MFEDKKLILRLPKLSFKKLKWPKLRLPIKNRRKFFKITLLVLLFVLVCGLGTAVGVFRAILQNLPDIEQLAKFEPGIITYIYADDGTVVGEYALEKRIQVTFEDIPDNLINGIIATEDPRFYSHKGIDFLGMLRALKENVRLIFTPHKLQGGSTISQQLVKKLFLHPKQTIRRKLKEMILAIQLEKHYSKDEILTMYCNQFDLGDGRVYGVEAAAQLYFDKSASEMNLPEAALITGIFRAPSRYFPYRNYDEALGRRNHVINRMVSESYISKEVGDEARHQSLNILPLHRADSDFAGYFLEEVRKYLYDSYGMKALYSDGLRVHTTLNPAYQKRAEDAVRKQLHILDKGQGWRDDKPNLLESDLEIGNLEELVESIWDERARKNWMASWRRSEFEEELLIEAVVLEVTRTKAKIKVKEFTGEIANQGIEWTKARNLTALIEPGDVIHVKIKSFDPENLTLVAELDQEPKLESAVLAIEPQTGQVKAMVGGYSFRRSKWNNAIQAMRQAGSVIKPLLYTAAIDTGAMTTVTPFVDEPVEFEDKWSGEIWDPPNYDGKYKGRVTLRQGIEESRNIVTAKMLRDISPQLGVDYCRKFGITSTVYPYLSLSLGAFEVKMLELVSAFTVFPNSGVRVTPYFISRIEDKDGNIMEEYLSESEEVISPQVAYIMTSLLQGVVQRGTSQGVRHLTRYKQLAGKTGTTDDWADARFVGFSPSLCVGVWVGHNEGRVTIGERQSGAVAALPIFTEFFTKLIEEETMIAKENDEEYVTEEFVPPPNLEYVQIDRKTGLLPTLVCLPQFIITEVFLPGTAPNRFCSNEDHLMTYDYYEILKQKRD
ncbi:MAG: PBP1A family penicillin-binding protein [Candidatus Aminicenantaceae bacterium]